MTTEERLVTLERQLASYRRCTLLFGGLVCIAAAFGFAPSDDSKSISVHSITLTDNSGKVAAVITGNSEGEVTFSSPDHPGKIAMAFGADFTVFLTRHEEMKASLNVEPEEIGFALTDDKINRQRILMQAFRPGTKQADKFSAGVMITDRYGDVQWQQIAR